MLLGKHYGMINNSVFHNTPAVNVYVATNFTIHTEKEAIDFADLVGTAPPDEYPVPTVFIDDKESVLDWNLLKVFIHRLITRNNFKVIYKTDTLINDYNKIPENKNIAERIYEKYKELSDLFVIGGTKDLLNFFQLEISINTSWTDANRESALNYYAPKNNQFAKHILDSVFNNNVIFTLDHYVGEGDDTFILEFANRWLEQGLDLRRKNMLCVSCRTCEDATTNFCLKNAFRMI